LSPSRNPRIVVVVPFGSFTISPKISGNRLAGLYEMTAESIAFH
jgi:hypothetical protein